MKVKVRSGRNSEVFTVSPDIKVLDLISLFPGTSLNDITVSFYKFGFPIKTVDALSDATLHAAGIGANELLNVESRGDSPDKKSNQEPKPETDNKICNVYIDKLHQYMILRNVPDDNSCLFNAILYALTGNYKWPDLNLRHIVAETIRNNPTVYDELVIGRPNDKYCDWIEKLESWGGAIELGILAAFLDVRINCFDVELGNMMVFQDEQSVPTKFIALVYSGIHYDCLVTNNDLTETKTHDVGNWMDHESEIVDAGKTIVLLLQKHNYATNTTTFRVRCLICYEVLVGEMGASKHANDTGHYLFGEVK